MKKIVFRGRRVDNGKWVYGQIINKRYIKNDIMPDSCYDSIEEHTYIYEDNYENYTEEYPTKFVEVVPETVGQFVGLYDKDGNAIYEGDILENTAVNFRFTVDFTNTKQVLRKIDTPEDSLDMYDFYHRIPTMFEKIGTIYDKDDSNEAN